MDGDGERERTHSFNNRINSRGSKLLRLLNESQWLVLD